MIAIALLALLCGKSPAQAQLACGHFTTQRPAPPTQRRAASALRRFAAINRAVLTEPYRILFLGDSITERFDPEVWRRNMAPRGVLNAGVSGDRTEHLLWRLQHGNLAGPPPRGFVVLIGTNDLTYRAKGNGSKRRSPALTAEGIRADLLYLRQHQPQARILLLGLTPRSASPEARLRRATLAVNRLIRDCGDRDHIVYADIGGVLLDREGRLTRKVSPDLLHFSRIGYKRLMPRLDALIDDFLIGR